MKICIIGAGAMGSLFGGILSTVAPVTLIDPWRAHIEAIQRDGLRMTTGAEERILRLPAIWVSNEGEIEKLRGTVGEVDLAIILVKSPQTAWAAGIARQLLSPNGLALTLQNGLGNGEILAAAVGEVRTCVGVTSHGATLLGPGRVLHAGQGPTYLGRTTHTATKVAAVAELFAKAGLEVHVSDDLDSLLWGKLVINAGINALTALLRVQNGVLEQIEPLRELMGAIVREAAAVAQAKGITLPYLDPVEKVREVCRATAVNRSSMLQDALRGQPTEIEVINGAIVREAARLGIPAPVNQTIYNLIKGMEATYGLRQPPT